MRDDGEIDDDKGERLELEIIYVRHKTNANYIRVAYSFYPRTERDFSESGPVGRFVGWLVGPPPHLAPQQQ